VSITESIAERVAAIEQRIAAAAARAGRERSEITLVAVSKTHPAEAVAQARHAGLHDFGENRVQEGSAKRSLLALDDVRWHLLGPLQRNKVRLALRTFDILHAVDRPELVEELTREAEAQGRQVPLFLEINLGGEGSKHGVAPGALEPLLDAVLSRPALRPMGLMAIPPQVAEPEASRPWFRKLRELRDELVRSHGEAFPGQLSMGMSNDFEVAIEEGATHVRVGTAIFGIRT
jgi:pyridoxal phosphate enzyme (YggS family)